MFPSIGLEVLGMISLTEVAERAQKGPKLNEKEWSMGMFRKMQELADKHELKIGEVGKFYEVDSEYATSSSTQP